MKWHNAMVTLMLLIFASGCTNRANTNLNLTAIEYGANGTAGKEITVTIRAVSPSDFQNVPVAISAIFQQEQEGSVEIDETAIESLKAGEGSYELKITLPRDLEEGEYTLIANLDPSDLLGDWNDTLQFEEGTTLIQIDKLTSDEVALSISDEDSNASASAALAHNSSSSLGETAGTLPPITLNYIDENLSLGINAVLHLYLARADEIDLNITACLETVSGCTTLPLWNPEGNGTLNTLMNIENLEHGVNTLVSIDAVILSAQVTAIANSIRDQLLLDPLTFPSVDAVLKVTLTFGNQQQTYRFGVTFNPSNDLMLSLVPGLPSPPVPPPVPPFGLGKRLGGLPSCRPKLLHYKKTFKKYKYGKRFGAGVYVKGDAKLDSSGLHTTVKGIVKAKILGRKDTLMDLDFTADALPGSFEDTGYDLTLDVVKITVYSKSKSLSDSIGGTPEVTEQEEAAIDLKIQNHETNLSKSTLMKQKLYKKANKKVKTYSGSDATKIGYAKQWDIGKKRGHSQQFVVGIVPITITAGAQATIGFEADILLQGITSLRGSFTPNAKIGAYASGGVGTHGMSAGIEADLWLVTEELKNDVTASLVFGEDANHTYITELNGTIEEKITNYYRGPNGKLYLYARYPTPRYCRSWGVRYICGHRTRHRRKYLAKWKTSRSRRTLLHKKQNLFSIPLNDCN
jgi:hypothetical protein